MTWGAARKKLRKHDPQHARKGISPLYLNKLLSILLLSACAFFGGVVGNLIFGTTYAVAYSILFGVAFGFALMWFLSICMKTDWPKVLGGSIGFSSGVVLATLLYYSASKNISNPQLSLAIFGLMVFVMGLVGLQLGSAKIREFILSQTDVVDKVPCSACILDTSVIIDGRISDVCETGFFVGDIIIPQFVLNELQMIADSSESTKRTRGRRGLDILNKMKKQTFVSVVIDETDYPGIREVDQKLIQMAKEKGCAIFTNDYNLNKVAEVHSIQVLNINQLANALKPIVLPGETMRVQVVKDGKEPGQGLGYLDDGTMVVIENGRKHTGKLLDVTVTSVLQTTAGRMIFAAVKN
jgi:uncharacterized protein YacL